SPLPGGRPFHGANLMSPCCSTKVSFGSIGEVFAAPGANAVRMEESRNVRRFMILSSKSQCSFAKAPLCRGRRSFLDGEPDHSAVASTVRSRVHNFPERRSLFERHA